MALSNAQYQSIIHGYEVTQLNNHRIMEERLQEVNSHVDGFKELSASIASVSVSQGRKLLEGDDSALTDLRDTIRRLSGMKQDLLVNAGYPITLLPFIPVRTVRTPVIYRTARSATASSRQLSVCFMSSPD